MYRAKSDPLPGSHPDLPQYEFQQNDTGEFRWVFHGADSMVISPITYMSLNSAVQNAKYAHDCSVWETRRKAWKKIDLSVQTAAPSATSVSSP